MSKKPIADALGTLEVYKASASTAEELQERFFDAIGRIGDLGYVLTSERVLAELCKLHNGQETYLKIKMARRLGGGPLFMDESVKGIKVVSSDAGAYAFVYWAGA